MDDLTPNRLGHYLATPRGPAFRQPTRPLMVEAYRLAQGVPQQPNWRFPAANCLMSWPEIAKHRVLTRACIPTVHL